MQRSSNLSSIKIQMNNFTLNLQTLLSKDHEQLATTQRKPNNKTDRRTRSNFEDVSPFRTNKKNNHKQQGLVKDKAKREDVTETAKVSSKPSNLGRDKREMQDSKKSKKTEQKPAQQHSKGRKDKSSRLERHFTDYDHVIESARLRTSPSRNYNYYNFNSESRSKSASRSRSKSHKKIVNERQKSGQKSRSKSIFLAMNNNERLVTERSASKMKIKKQAQKFLQSERCQQKLIKKRRSSKSRYRERKSIDNCKLGKSKSRERIYTQVSSRHPLDDRHFNSDHVNQIDDKVFMSHKKSKSKFEKLSDKMMSNSSELGGEMKPKMISNKAYSKEKGEKFETKKKSKKLPGTVSTAKIQKTTQNQNEKQKKLISSKKVKPKPSKQQLKQKSLDSQFNFFQSTNVEKKRSTEENLEVKEKTTVKKSKRLKMQAGNVSSNKFEVGELSGFKKREMDKQEGFVIEKAFKKKKKVIDVVERLFNNAEDSGEYRHKQPQFQIDIFRNEGSNTERIHLKSRPQEFSSSNHQTQVFATKGKVRQFPQTKKLTIMTDFNEVENKEIYFDDISKILLKQQKSRERDSKDSMSRSGKSIKEEVMESRKGSVSHQWNGGSGDGEEDELNQNARMEKSGSDEDDGEQDKSEDLLHTENKTGNKKIHKFESKGDNEIRKIRAEDLDESLEEDQGAGSQSEQGDSQSEEKFSPSQQENVHELNDLEELNSHLEKLISNQSDVAPQIIQNGNRFSPLSKEKSNKQSSNNLSIRQQASFGVKVSSDKKNHPKSSTLIPESKSKTSQHNANQGSQRDLPVQKQKKAVSSTFISSQVKEMRSPIYSPSSYAMENKQKVMSSLLNKPRKSIEEQFMIAKTLSNKRLLEELELLDTLEKIEKSVENSLVHEGGIAKGYFGVGRQDEIAEGAEEIRNYQSNRGNFWSQGKEEKNQPKQKEKAKQNAKEEKNFGNSPVFFDNPSQQEINHLQDELLSRQVTPDPTSNKKAQFAAKKQASRIQLQKSPQTLLLTSGRLKSQPKSLQEQCKEDSPLLSNTSNEFKRSPVIVPFLKTKELKVNPFQHSYEEIENFFSNTSCRMFGEGEGEVEVNEARGEKNGQGEGTRGGRKIDCERLQNSDEDSELNHDQGERKGTWPEEKNSKKKVDFSDLTLEFEKEMDDYLKDNEKASVKAKLQQIKSNALTGAKKQTFSPFLSENQNQTLQKSDDFFYYNNSFAAQPESVVKKSKPSQNSEDHTYNSELIKSQLCSEVQNRLLREFCQELTKNKEILHAFLYFVSRCNLVVVGEDEGQEQQRGETEQREVNQEKFMEYLQSRISASNEYIMSLGGEVMEFVRRSQENEEVFLRNINRSFGIPPLKTLKWMRKVYAEEEENRTGNRGREEDDKESKDEENEDDGSNQSVSGLSDCESVQAIFPPTLLADFDAHQSQNVFQEMNQEQFYLNHAVYAALNEICDRHRPFGENGYPVIAKQKPRLTVSVKEIQPKIMKRLVYLLGLRWGRIQFAPDEQPEKVINETYKRMDEDIRQEDDERWSERNMDDTVFENVYYLAKHVIEAVINQEVMEVFRMMGR